uniref:Spore germination protein n=1 Tax=Globodera pallida TaxID=36090 RepID=A0A183CC22_GLOPA
MSNFKEFSEGRGPKSMFSSPVVYINGIFLQCTGDETGTAFQNGQTASGGGQLRAIKFSKASQIDANQ